MLFFRHVAIYRVTTFFIKIDVLFRIHYNSQKQLVVLVVCFKNFSKTDSEKNEKIHIRDTKYYIENICHQFPDLYNQISGEFQVQKQPPVVFFK